MEDLVAVNVNKVRGLRYGQCTTLKLIGMKV
jgi:hypothetical protein